MPLYIRAFGKELFGIYILITSFLGIMGILDLGISGSALRFTAHYLSIGKTKEASSVWSGAFLFGALPYIVVALLIAIIPADMLTKWAKLQADSAHQASVAIRFAAWTLPLGFWIGLAATANKAIGDFRKSTIIFSTFSIGINVLNIICVMLGGGIVHIMILGLCYNLLFLLLIFMLLINKLPIKLTLSISWTMLKPAVAFNAWQLLGKISDSQNCGSIYNNCIF